MDLPPPVNTDPRRALPAIHEFAGEILAEDPGVLDWAALEAAQQVVGEARSALAAGPGEASENQIPQGKELWLRRGLQRARELAVERPRRVLNATGVVLHTNLGRAPMALGAAEAAARAAAGYSDLELDIGPGRRGNRLASVCQRLALASGAEAAYACNNNAAALVLILNTLARGREVIVSRGELVEIGGSFRVPEIMERAGVKLVEVGSTNRTHLRDYAGAIGPETAMLLKVHRSNFEQRGFVKEVSLAELAELGRDRGVPVVEDLGSGSLEDLAPFGFPAEAYVPRRLSEGPDLVCFSGDKLLGGPQAGIVVGDADLMASLAQNPMARALRLDKMSLAALHWTLGAYLSGRAREELPVLRRLLTPSGDHEKRTRGFAGALGERLQEKNPALNVEVVENRVPVGGGSLPGFEIESWAIALMAPGGAEALAGRLRSGAVPVLSRVRDGATLVDLRAVDDADEPLLLESLLASLH
ncbi:MAG: L-seryl-tRNA(Sec) selenium transferase [Myxococcota bacterium]|nr:L-seryl-tRNA(Sec) selenium transferase [Myxococcota bacterium]